MKDWLGPVLLVVIVVGTIAGLVYLVIHSGEVLQARTAVRFSACNEAGYADIIQWNAVDYCVTIRDGELRGVPLAPLLEEAR
jgi:hypothetical protein